MTDAQRLMDLFQTDPKERDEFWKDRLNAAFWPTRLGSFTPHVMKNDLTGIYAYRLGKHERDGGEAPTEPAAIVDWAISMGVGIILWPSDEPHPLWSFSPGDLLSYRLYGTSFAPRFWDAPEDRGGKEMLQKAEQVLTGSPNEQMFPPLVRTVVRKFMQEKLGLSDPRVTLAQRKGEASRLVFKLQPSHFGGEQEAFRAFTAVACHIPNCIPLYHIPFLFENHEGFPI